MLDLALGAPALQQSAPLADFCRSLATFLRDHVDPLAIDRDHAIPRSVLDEVARLGTFGVTIPEAWGGSGLGLLGACAVVDTIARRDRSLATTVGLHLGLGTRGLVAFGTEAQKSRWLPELAAGTRIGAFSATEPGAGSDLSRLATRVAPGAPGRLVVNGHKIYVTNGGLADVFTVAAASPGLSDAAAGASLVVLERGDAGLSVGAEERKLGLRGSSTTPLWFEDLEVPADRLLGPPGDGQQLLSQILAWGRTAMAAGCAGTAHAALDLATRHVAQRRQFGRPLSNQPVVRRQLADMAADLYAIRALIARTVRDEDNPVELERLSLAAKVYCSETDWNLCDRAIQLMGGSGYIEESGAPLLLRDARITRIFEGANDVLLTRLGSIELMHPRALRQTGTRADAIADEVHGVVAGLRESRGLKTLRHPEQLHWLGRLVVARDVAWALAERVSTGATTEHTPLLARALARTERAVRVIACERDDNDSGDVICAQLLEELA